MIAAGRPLRPTSPVAERHPIPRRRQLVRPAGRPAIVRPPSAGADADDCLSPTRERVHRRRPDGPWATSAHAAGLLPQVGSRDRGYPLATCRLTHPDKMYSAARPPVALHGCISPAGRRHPPVRAWRCHACRAPQPGQRWPGGASQDPDDRHGRRGTRHRVAVLGVAWPCAGGRAPWANTPWTCTGTHDAVAVLGGSSRGACAREEFHRRARRSARPGWPRHMRRGTWRPSRSAIRRAGWGRPPRS